MEEEKEYAANSEIRFITLELMKIAKRSGKSFAQVAAEYIDNAELLQQMLQQGERSFRKAKHGAILKQK